MSALKTKEEIECEFHKFTNNIFMDKLPSDIQAVVSKPGIKTSIHANILEHIIRPINIKTKLGLEDKSLGMPKIKRFIVSKQPVKKKIVSLLNSSVFYITNSISKDCKQLLFAANPTNEIKDKFPEVKEIIDLLNTLDFSNIKSNLSKVTSKYSIVILDSLESGTPIISGSFKSENFLVFYRINKLIGKALTKQLIMPVYLLNHNEPEKSSFIFNSSEIKSAISNIESLITIPHDESTSQSSQPDESKSDTASKPKSPVTSEVTPEYKPETHPVDIPELSNLESNPYDKNQYLRVISFKEIPDKTFLQGRAKPDIKTTSYNLYENKDDNKLVGVLQFKETSFKVTVNVKWCLNYTPN